MPVKSSRGDSRGSPWFDDGNAILVCGNAILVCGNSVFKVYKGILLRHSPVFADYFRASAREVNGHPCIQLDDSISDLEAFLMAIYGDPDSILCQTPLDLKSNRNFESLAGVLRLATKYKAQSLRARALRPFQKLYPSTLSKWEDISSKTLFTTFPDPVPVINLAHEKLREALGPAVSGTTPLKFSPGLLHLKDLEAYTLMKEYNHKSTAKMLKLFRELGNSSEPECQNRSENRRMPGCQNSFVNILSNLSQLLYMSEVPIGYPHFIFALKKMLNKEGICNNCGVILHARMNLECVEWWDKLPDVLGFSGWNDSRITMDFNGVGSSESSSEKASRLPTQKLSE